MKTNGKAHNYQRIAMACQGGGSLGAYHIGALKAMEQAGYAPNVVAGISIGAFTAAIIAGSEPRERVEKLGAFWDAISWPDYGAIPGGLEFLKRCHNQVSSLQGILFGQPNFFVPRFPPPQLQPPGTPAATSYYDTGNLRETLLEYADFDRINAGRGARLILGAARVRDGRQIFFDSELMRAQGKRLGPEHVMASGAMPPGFPGVRIEGELYWDGGCLSNTPLDGIYQAGTGMDTLCFMIDLFGPNGKEPQDLDDVNLLIKELQFSSRTTHHVEQIRQRHNLAHLLCRALERAPREASRDPRLLQARERAARARFDIVHIVYHKPYYEVSTCDCEFSKASILDRIAHGYRDMKKALEATTCLRREQAQARDAEGVGCIVHTFAEGSLLESSFESRATLPSQPRRAAEARVRSRQA
jgi:NTE family protein